ncbi:alginate O-acetyltransferase AlgX-related protein [Parabacteroides pacaensis]|uniref:alginate O-acetyltransferase AlgX-related protein n=1 Tax=Parabacteroides pacaensis TaxID=2086575 RepID=UPI000D0FCD01|nr:hypothetical protein [Parabacteroides pacaensis]
MKQRKSKLLVVGWMLYLLAVSGYSMQAQNDTFLSRCREGAKNSSIAVNGNEQWCFLKSELRHLSIGEFWGEKAQKTSQAKNPEQKDPLKAIVAYQEALKKENIRLVLVPIPPKAVVYPDKLPGNPLSLKRYDETLQNFYKTLRAKGVDVLDLTDDLIKGRTQTQEPLFCLGDSHLSGEGCKLVASKIAEHIRVKGKKQYTVTPEKITMKGDLYKVAKEMPVNEQRIVYRVAGDETKDKSSPVLLLGDSHTLVFDIGGDLFAQNAGLASLLASQLKMPVDVMGVRGSGATPARINVYRRSKQEKEFLKQKKVVVWCFTAREFTEASGWNANVPLK